MKNAGTIVGLSLLVLAAIAGWQIGSVYLSNIELTGDLKDLSSLTGMRIGLVDPRSDAEFRDLVIAKGDVKTIEDIALGTHKFHFAKSSLVFLGRNISPQRARAASSPSPWFALNRSNSRRWPWRGRAGRKIAEALVCFHRGRTDRRQPLVQRIGFI